MSMISSTSTPNQARPAKALVQVIVVSDNLLSSELVKEKLSSGGLNAEMRSTLEDALHCGGEPRPVVVWMLAWPHEHNLLDRVDAYAKALPLLVLGTGCPQSVQAHLLLAGVRGYVDHREGWETLQQALAQVAAGGRRYSQDILCQSIDLLQKTNAGEAHRPSSILTPREKLIANMVVHGACNKDIAQQLNLSESTVKSHMQHIFVKLGVGSRLALALHMLKYDDGLAEPPERA